MADDISTLMLSRVHAVANAVKIILVIAVLMLLLWPGTHLRIGNLFFNGSTSGALYNVHLAQFFYTYAAYAPLFPDVEFAHYQLSRTYFIQGDLEVALREAEREAERFPENTRTYYILGLTHAYLNQPEEAIAAFSVFIDANPNSWAARNDKSWVQIRIGDIEGAYATMEPLKDIHNPWVQNTLGTIYLNLGKPLEAKQAYRIALQVVEGMSDAEWGTAYPGNDPEVQIIGREQMIASIEENIALISGRGDTIEVPVEDN